MSAKRANATLNAVLVMMQAACMYLAHHELESKITIVVIIITMQIL